MWFYWCTGTCSVSSVETCSRQQQSFLPRLLFTRWVWVMGSYVLNSVLFMSGTLPTHCPCIPAVQWHTVYIQCTRPVQCCEMLSIPCYKGFLCQDVSVFVLLMRYAEGEGKTSIAQIQFYWFFLLYFLCYYFRGCWLPQPKNVLNCLYLFYHRRTVLKHIPPSLCLIICIWCRWTRSLPTDFG